LYRITTTTTTLFVAPAPTPAATALGLPSPAQHYADLQNASATNALAGQFGHVGPVLWGALSARRREAIAHARLIDGLYGEVRPVACDRCAANGLVCRMYHTAFYSQKTLGHWCSGCRLANKKCSLPRRAPKPRPSRAGRGKGGRGGRGGRGGKEGLGGGHTAVAI
jgi:hypothetical protein